ncbi:MAG TPA: 50S ribosomal protein L4 [Atribacteraceae bacterium]|nr:50S ribosomal protein L4 [Atribacteraceae bacterium]
MELDVINREGEKVDTIRLVDGLFPSQIDSHIVFLAAKTYLDNQRQGTAKTKTRSEVSGGGRKPWRQKGTGRARHGTNRSPIWRGGGIVFGPQPRDYSHKLPGKEKRVAFRNALAWLIHNNRLRIVESIALDEVKTKNAVSYLTVLGAQGKVLLVTETPKQDQGRAFANIPQTDMVFYQELNTYALLGADTVLMERGALTRLQEVLRDES